jgi:hypothetical protein
MSHNANPTPITSSTASPHALEEDSSGEDDEPRQEEFDPLLQDSEEVFNKEAGDWTINWTSFSMFSNPEISCGKPTMEDSKLWS